MAVDDLQFLNKSMREVFDNKQLPPGWEDDWLIIPIEDPEASQTDTLEGEIGSPDSVAFDGLDPSNRVPNPGHLPDFGEDWKGPGSPFSRVRGGILPPDALAFYLPFHYFFPTWWGIYITVDGADWLAERIKKDTDGKLTKAEALVASRLFLYGHEAYHHAVECFSARLEISHRTPLYKSGFEELYKRTCGKDECVEEALATAKGFKKAGRRFGKDKEKERKIKDALREYIDASPPGYRQAMRYSAASRFKRGECEFAEQNVRDSIPDLPPKNNAVWLSFPHAFSGIGRINSRVNYLIRRGSPLADRMGLHLRYLQYRDLVQKLRDHACQFVRQGRGSHEIWKSKAGITLPVPRHPGDLKTGTLSGIIKQAGLNMTVQEFVSS